MIILKIITMPAGVYAANCYIVYSENTKIGIIVDPGGDVEDLIKVINENHIKLEYIVLTHGHGDHIGGVKELKNKYNIPLLIHGHDIELIQDGKKNLSNIMAMGPIELIADMTLKDGDVIEFGGISALVLHTPGHTKGGICLKIDNYIITGDTLFKGSIGRTDLLGGDYEELINSIKTKLLVLSNETIVLPGHGQPSSIGKERISNPFLK